MLELRVALIDDQAVNLALLRGLLRAVQGTVAVPASNFQVSLAMAMALSMADCVIPTLVRLLPRGPKSGLVRELLSSS